MATIIGSGGNDTLTSLVNSLGGPLATAGADSLEGLGGEDHLEAGGGNDTVFGGNANDSLEGGAGDDVLVGGNGNDTLDGGAGADQLVSGGGLDWVSYASAGGGVFANLFQSAFNTGEAAGDSYGGIPNLRGSAHADTLFGTTLGNVIEGLGGDDLIRPGEGANTADGGAGNDTLEDLSGNSLLRGGAGQDSLHGNILPDTLAGSPEADTLEGGAGADTIRAIGTGATLAYWSAAEGVRAFLDDTAGNAGDAAGDVFFGLRHLQGSAHGDTLRGNALDNLVLGLDGDDSLEAQSPDTLIGQLGDTLDGGSGADSYLYAPGAIILDSGTDGARDRLRTATALVELLPAIEDLDLLGSLVLGVGNALDNRVLGNAANNILSGGEGADTLDGGTGNDVLVGGFGRDVFLVDSRHDTVVDEADAPGHVIASVGWRLGEFLADLTLAGPANIQAIGNALDNRIIGNAARNALNGFTGADTLLGGDGNDSLLGRDGNDLLRGEAGGDLLNGDAGADTLDGGAGPDTLNGGAGSDAFVFSVAPTQADRINDYAAGEPLRLHLAAFDPGAGTGLVPGALAAQPGRFLANTTGLATTAAARFIHETDAGRLFFDADGAGAGAALLVVTLAGAPALSAAEIVMI